LFGPYLARLSDELDAERRSRIRVEERAEIAAHLHDGVLQTLALVQKRADDPKEVARLARRQERELRSWLHGAPAGGVGAPSPGPSAAGEAGPGAGQHPADSPPTVAARLRVVLADVEDDHGVRVELVSVGDHPLDQAGEALVSAVREAAVNAARHSGAATVDVFVEAGGDVLEAFVRDRGVGFDPTAVAADRRGLSESIVGRIERAGGTAVVTSTPGRGTEVQLSVPSAGSAYRRTIEPGGAP
jgi:signal transduction histidine kinase